MSIASAITAAQGKVADCYTAISGKGGTLPATQNLSNMPTAINSIPSGGGGGLGLREISQQGVIQVPSGSVSLPSNVTNIGDYGMYGCFYYSTTITSLDLSSLTTISGLYAMQYFCYNCTSLTSVDLSNLTTIDSVKGGMVNSFYGNTSITSVDLSSLTTVNGEQAMQYAFVSCAGLTSLDLSSLTTVTGRYAMGYAFRDCTNLASVDLSNLTSVSGDWAMNFTFHRCTALPSISLNNLQTIGNSAPSSTDCGQFASFVRDCSSITSMTFPKLEKIYCTGASTSNNGTFGNNNKLEKMYFPKLDTITYGSGASSTNQNACLYVFGGCAALTELHFGAVNETAIKSSPGWSTAWGRGAGNVTIYFDL